MTLTRELAKIFTSFGMDRTALETSSHRGVRTSWVPSQHELASLAEVECGQIHDAAHDDADVADAATAADADADAADVHDVRRLGASTTDVGTHRVGSAAGGAAGGLGARLRRPGRRVGGGADRAPGESSSTTGSARRSS